MNKVDLLFDARCYKMSGIGRYIKGELSALGFKIPGTNAGAPAPGEPLSGVGLLCRPEDARWFIEAGCENIAEWEARPFSAKEQFFSSSFLGKALKMTDTVWFPHWNVPIVFSQPKGVEIILTVHDLIPWTFPAYAKTLKSRLGWPIFLNAVRKADVIRCVSKATRDVLLEKVPEARNKKTEVRYPNVLPPFLNDPVFRRNLREKPWPEKWNFEKGQYALYVGNLKPHKGIDFLIEVWQEVQGQLPSTARLVLVGKSFGQDLPGRIARTTKAVGLGEVTDEELWQLYANAKVFCFPSFAEGYGIPPLEALALGSMTMTSGIPSVKEVLGQEVGIPLVVNLWTERLLETFFMQQDSEKETNGSVFKTCTPPESLESLR
ncbi:MAG: glycosyltransferase [Synergistales bacterium]